MPATYLSYAPSATAITGRQLAHGRYSLVERAFLASDLHSGAKLLVAPTRKQSAQLANINLAYAFWATKRETERPEILRGLIPLVPPPAPKVNGNGHDLTGRPGRWWRSCRR